MKSYICPACLHVNKTDRATFDYLTNHPPVCLECGYQYKAGDQAKNEQIKTLLKKSGYARALRLCMELYDLDQMQAISKMASMGHIDASARLAGKKGAKKGGIFLTTIIILSSLAGFTPMFVGLFSPPPQYVLSTIYVPDGKTGTVWQINSDDDGGGRIRIFVTDIASGKTIKKIKIKTTSRLLIAKGYYNNGKVWIVSGQGENSPLIMAYNISDFSPAMTTEQFVASEPLLKGGIASISTGKPWVAYITTRDGKKLYYHIRYEKLFIDMNSLENFEAENDVYQSQWFVMKEDKQSSHIRNLYLVTPKQDSTGKLGKDLASRNNYYRKQFTYINDPSTVNMKILRARPFLNGAMLYQDENMAMIAHYTEVGTDGSLLFTGIDATGKELFVLPEDQFPNPEVWEERAPGIIGNMRIEKYGALFVLGFPEMGMCGIDLNTGEKLWEYEEK